MWAHVGSPRKRSVTSMRLVVDDSIAENRITYSVFRLAARRADFCAEAPQLDPRR